MRHGCSIMVETGTYEGDTVAVVRQAFDKVYTIELNAELHRRAVRRFRRSKNVEVMHGDSSQQLERLIHLLDRPTLFWLDAHYSRGGARTSRGKYDPPLMFELSTILRLREPRHVVLIDDARCCGVEPGWPTYEELERQVDAAGLGLIAELNRDIVPIHAPIA